MVAADGCGGHRPFSRTRLVSVKLPRSVGDGSHSLGKITASPEESAQTVPIRDVRRSTIGRHAPAIACQLRRFAESIMQTIIPSRQ